MKPILLVGEFHDDQSARFDRPLAGPSGAELLRMLNESGIISFTFADARKETNKIEKGVEELTFIAKTVRGVQKMEGTGETMKKIS